MILWPSKQKGLLAGVYGLGQGFNLRREVEFRIELVQGATPIAKAHVFWCLQRCKSCWNNCKGCKVKVSSDLVIRHGEAPVLFVNTQDGSFRMHIDYRELRGARVAFEDEFGATEEREVEGRSGVKRKLFGSRRNNMGNERILALPEGSDDFVMMRGARVRIRLNMRKRRWMELFSECGFETKYHMGKANEVVDAWSRKERVKPRRV
nr:putative reverse transcriptase domain-containing protein [Tanacetum cinerariifolium]